jgi:transposase
LLVERSVMEQRYQAVLAVVQDSWRVVEVANRVGVSRQTVHTWIDRYEAGANRTTALLIAMSALPILLD